MGFPNLRFGTRDVQFPEPAVVGEHERAPVCGQGAGGFFQAGRPAGHRPPLPIAGGGEPGAGDGKRRAPAGRDGKGELRAENGQGNGFGPAIPENVQGFPPQQQKAVAAGHEGAAFLDRKAGEKFGGFPVRIHREDLAAVAFKGGQASAAAKSYMDWLAQTFGFKSPF